jgi:alpha-beta hydrolase superfamily lysophospholipase
VFTLHHDVRVGRHRHVHVTERFTLRAWLQRTHRGALLLPGTIVNSSFYELDVEGYRFASDLAERGFFTFAIDAEGSGESSYPADGATVTHAFLVDEATTVLRALRAMRWIPRMDIIGESNGGGVAAELCADSARTRSCVLASMIYVEGTPFFEAVFQDPAFLAYLSSQPNNYLDVGADLYFNIAARASSDVADAILATQPGLYATPPLTVAASLPWFDPSRARVPGLIIQGTEDNIGSQADSDMLAADYGSAPGAGGVASIIRIEGGGHVPRIEPAPVSDAYRDAVFTFLGTP